MASGGSTLRFTIEVAADQATQALKATTLAFDQAGVKAKGAFMTMGSAAKGAKTETENLRTSLSRARGTAMFFTQAIGEFGPQGRTAQIAISGVAGAIMGGGGLLLALSLAQAGARLLADAWGEEAAAAKKASEESVKWGEKIHSETIAFLDDVTKSIEGMRGATAAMQQMRTGIVPLQEQEKLVAMQLAEARERQAEAEEKLREAQRKGQIGAYGQLATDISKAKAEVAELQPKLERLNETIKQRTAAVSLVVDAEQQRAAKEAADKAAEDARQKSKQLAADLQRDAKATANERQKTTVEGIKAEIAAMQEAAEMEINIESWVMQRKEEIRAEAEEKQNAAFQKQIQMASTLGEAYGFAFAQMATGAATFEQAMGSMLKQTVNMVINAVKVQILADAAASAAAAFKSQAGIPIIGPLLGAGAAIAALTFVQGLIGSVPSAAGGWKVPHDTIAMVHEDERILPARYSKGLDRMVEGGGAGGVTVNITATDAKGVRRLFLDNAGALAEAIGRAVRDGRRFA